MMASTVTVMVAIFIIVVLIITFTTRIKKCPSDHILVVYGNTFGKRSGVCVHGGAKFIVPVFQDYGYLSLRPIKLDVNLQNALCKQNIRINIPSVFTVGISTDEALMSNAADRLLGLRQDAIADLAKDIILSQLRQVIASMTIEQINAGRETFLKNIEDSVTEELNKIGLQLLNVHVTDITDESGYIDAIGKRAAAEAINKARKDVALAEKAAYEAEMEAQKARAQMEVERQRAEAEKLATIFSHDPGEADSARRKAAEWKLKLQKEARR